MKKIGKIVRQLIRALTPRIKPVPVPVKIKTRKHQNDSNY